MTMTPAQLRDAVNAANPGRNWNQLCQAFVWQAINVSRGGVNRTYASAKAARLATNIVSMDYAAAPPGMLHYWIIGAYDHLGVSLGDGIVVYATAKGDTIEGWGTDLKVSHVTSYPATYAGWGPNGVNGTVDVSSYLTPAPLAGNQRQVLGSAPANRRGDPSTSNPPVGSALAAGATGNFDGWIHGQNVNGNDVWFRGTPSGNWFWSGGFTDGGTHDLADLNPVVAPPVVTPPVVTPPVVVPAGNTPPVVIPTVGPTQRQVLATASANHRAAPSTATAVVGNSPANTILTFVGFITGAAVAGNSTWFKVADSDYMWSGAFTDTGTHDLTDLTVVTPPIVVPPTPVTTTVVRTAGGIVVNRRVYPTATDALVNPAIAAGASINVSGFAHSQSISSNGITSDVWYHNSDNSWSWAGGFTSQDTSGIAEEVAPVNNNVLDPAAPWKSQTPDSSLAAWVGSPNYNRYASNPTKDHITLHWMSGTLSGTDATFQNPGPVLNGRGTGVATNYGIGLTSIHQYVLEKDYQHGDGDRGSNTTGVSIEHEGGYALADGTLAPVAQATLDLSAKLCADIAKRNNMGKLVLNVNVFPHNHWVATTCPGTLNMQYIVDTANQINSAVITPAPPTDNTLSAALTAAVASAEALEATIAGANLKNVQLQAQIINLQNQLSSVVDTTGLTAQIAVLQAKLAAIRSDLG